MSCGRDHVAELADSIEEHDSDLTKLGKILGASIARRREKRNEKTRK